MTDDPALEALRVLRAALEAGDAVRAAELAAALEQLVRGPAATSRPPSPAFLAEFQAVRQLATTRHGEVLELQQRFGRARGAARAYQER